MEKCFLFAIAFIFSIGCNSQSKITQVGKTMPDIKFEPAVNFEAGKTRISDFQGKPLIIDFWATWCAPCIMSFSEMHALSRKFGDRLNFVFVNKGESREKVDRFLQMRAKNGKKTWLPVAYRNADLESLLPDSSLPYYIWIDADGFLQKVTAKRDVTQENIELFISGKSIILKQSSSLPTITELKADPSVLWSTRLSSASRLEETSVTPYFRVYGNSDETSAILTRRTTMLDLFRIAYGTIEERGGTRSIRSAKIGLTVFPDSSSFKAGTHLYNSRGSGEIYSYQLLAPDGTSIEAMQKAMRADLLGWFGYLANVERRRINCLVLKVTNKEDLPKSTGQSIFKVLDSSFEMDGHDLTYLVQAVDDAINSSENFWPSFPLIDESGFLGNIGHIKIDDIDTSDYKQVQGAFSLYGIDLQLIQKEVEVLVVEKPH